MDEIKEFNDWSKIKDQKRLDEEIAILETRFDISNLTEDEAEWVRQFLILFAEKNITIEDFYDYAENPTNESAIGNILGGLTGFALGKRMGKVIAKVLGVEKGILYDMLTSRLFGAALGANLGKRII